MIVRAFFVVWFLPLMIAWGQEPRRQEPVAEARAGRPGPWDQDVAVWRVGRDGSVERLGVFERAGVATLARLKDGRLIAAHQHFPADSAADFDKVAVHFSEDDGRNWTPATGDSAYRPS
jgi:hypothetical protein